MQVNVELVPDEETLRDRLAGRGLKGTSSVFACAKFWPGSRLKSIAIGAVVEVFSESWGPCGSVLPTLKKFKMEKDPDPSCIQHLQVAT